MAVRVSAESGFDAAYVLKGQAERPATERTAGGYYINAAQAGEAARDERPVSKLTLRPL
jgi:hypothetical protein